MIEESLLRYGIFNPGQLWEEIQLESLGLAGVEEISNLECELEEFWEKFAGLDTSYTDL